MKSFYTICLFFLSTSLFSQSFENIENYQKNEGFFNYYIDQQADKVYLEVTDLEKEFLYVHALSSGIGSNDIGLDRGQLGGEKVVYFKKMGNKLMMLEPNQDYRALSSNKLEVKAVEQAFAKSIIHSFPITDQSENGYLIDLTPFLYRDAHGVSARLKRAQQGNYSLDLKRSALNTERTKAFEKNIEFDVYLTFAGTPTGGYIRSVTPDASAVTIAQHHSFIELPELNFEMRKFDTRSGVYPFTFMDYATPVEEPIMKRYVRRHRLEKVDPNAPISEAVEPIIYYLDNGTPEPVKSALLEGGRWWNQAFEAIGYKNAFQVKILPEDADPLDIRYNVIQWIHRSTRGWSYGSSVTDPRTGEIIKGHVSLGSLRIRQDFMIAQALMKSPYKVNDKNHNTMLELAIARIRQLSAHEIGHTLGFAHNFASSTNSRASVMDYPHPMFEYDRNGNLKIKEAYDTGIGEWDKVFVAYAYSDFADGVNENEALNAILDKAHGQGLEFISDSDARPTSSAHANAHLWDNGNDITDELNRVLDVRKLGIANFSESNIPSGFAYSELEDVFVPLYFFHRYQTEAAAKLLGGMYYEYSKVGSPTNKPSYVSKELQKKAMSALLRTLKASEIAIPKEKLNLFPPRAYGYPRTRESFKSKTGVAFDAYAAAETSANFTLGFLLNAERMNRMVQQKALDQKQYGFDDLLKELLNHTVKSKNDKGYYANIQEIINWSVLEHIMVVASDENAYPQVTEQVVFEMMRLKTYLSDKPTDPTAIYMLKKVNSFLGNPKGFKSNQKVVKIPDGSPIGMPALYQCFE
tara:strand:+ start:1295 stop:3709 length:2415 start_codon:yes stop_codon:yes gene_type:complete